jgi:hypothetical protein
VTGRAAPRSKRLVEVSRAVVALVAAVALLTSCGDDDEPDEPATTTTTTVGTTTTTVDRTTTTEPAGDLQPAVWPAADVVFDTPEEAAEDFVREVLGVVPTLGDFEPGDARSGEMELRSPGEGGGSVVPRGTLRLRQLGPDDGWFVVGVANDSAAIATPDAGAVVPPASILVEGVARGFEGTVVVRALVAGDADAVLDEQVVQAGAFETPEPFSVGIDLSGASAGDVVAVVVQGGTGLETDPGEVGALAVVIAD